MSEPATYPSLKGRQVFITGAATGIGAAVLSAFALQGALTGFVDLDEDAGHALARRLEEQTGKRPWFRALDVSDTDALQEAIKCFASSRDGIHTLINNVGNDTRKGVYDATPEDWRKSLSINLDAHFFATQAALPIMEKAGEGVILNMSSIVATMGLTEMPSYVAAKSALIGLSRALAQEFGPKGIRVNSILPGMVLTERQLELWITPEHEEEWMKTTPLKERLFPHHVAQLLLFLASDNAALITNQSFVIDGGKT